MIDIKLINIEDNEITLTTDNMHEKLSQKDAALQYIALTILNTPGTMIDDSDFGGGAKKLLNKTGDPESRAAEVIHDANVSILKHGPDFGPYSINGISVKNIEKDFARGYTIKISVSFENAIAEDFEIVEN